MAQIEVKTVIRADIMGGNWVDKAEATRAFAAYLESEWSSELKPLSDAGHDYHLTIECEPDSDKRSETEIVVRGHGANELSASEVERRLSDAWGVNKRWWLS
jgi:hypothetical protein